MDARLPTRGIVIAGAVAALLLAWQIVSVGVSRYLQDIDPAAAVRLRPHNGWALSALAERTLEKGRYGAAAGLARQAIANAPFDARAFRVLAQSREMAGDTSGARRLMEHAGSLNRRDPATAYWLYHDAMQAGRYGDAINWADALMRRAPNTTPLIVWELALSADNPGLASALVQHLGQAPPWRPALIQALYRGGFSEQEALAILNGLRKTEAPATADEITPFLLKMVRQGELDSAYSAWRGFLSPAERGAATSLIYDGQFRHPPGPAPFGWQLMKVDGADAALSSSTEGAGLQVRTGGLSNSQVIRQLLLAPAGRYRLASRARLIDGEAGELEWRVACEGAPAKYLLRMDLPLSGDKAGVATGEFTAPEGCEAQYLSLWTVGSDTPEPMTAWVDEVRLQTLRGPG